MAYSTSNPPSLETQAIAGYRTWSYSSTDAIADVNTDGYITNASDLGMKVGDVVNILETDTNARHIATVLTINSNGSADLSDGLAVGTTDTD